MSLKDDVKIIGNIFRSLPAEHQLLLGQIMASLAPAEAIFRSMPSEQAEALKASMISLGTAVLFKGPEKVIAALTEELKS